MKARAINPAEGLRLEYEATPDGWQWQFILRLEGQPGRSVATLEIADVEKVGRLGFLCESLVRYFQAGGSCAELQDVVRRLEMQNIPQLDIPDCFVAWMGPTSYGFQYLYVDKKTGGGWQVVEDSYAEPLEWSEIESLIRTVSYAV